jgi:hypothetical protein
MSTVELIVFAPEPGFASCSAASRQSAAKLNARAIMIRGFLIHLVAREVQLVERGAAWLRAVALQSEVSEVSEVCERLAAHNDTLREELITLVHRLVARWNWIERHRRLDAVELMAQPMTSAVAALVDLHETNVHGSTPWVELAAVRASEQMLASVVPLAIDIAGIAKPELAHAELLDASRLFGAREQRAGELTTVLADLVAADPQRSALVEIAEERAIAAFNQVLAECAKIGPELDRRRHGIRSC